MACEVRYTLEDAHGLALRCCSYSRFSKMLDLFWAMDHSDWLRLMGEFWNMCDNIGAYRLEARAMLPSTGPVVEMMTAEEVEAWHALPERLEVYRGCGPANMLGACWSLDRDVAARFPRLNRYRQAEPLLVTATVRRERVLAVKLDRNESEVITFGARRKAIERLSTAQAEVGSFETGDRSAAGDTVPAVTNRHNDRAVQYRYPLAGAFPSVIVMTSRASRIGVRSSRIIDHSP